MPPVVSSAPSPPLSGIRVLDFTQNLPGPYATHVLASLGAEVIKIEPPEGDAARGLGRLFDIVNAGKKSVVLDLKEDAARETLRALVKNADVLVEGFRPGVMARFGFSAEQALELQPRLVYCSMSSYGQEGPYRDYPGHDLNFQAIAGVCHLSREADERPVSPAIPMADLSSALTATSAIMAALLARAKSGEGRFIDVALVDTVASWSYVWGEGLVPSDARPSRSIAALRRQLGRREQALPSFLRPFASQVSEALGSGSVQRIADTLGERVKRSDAYAKLARLRLHALPHYALYRTLDDRWLSIGIVSEHKFWVALCDALELPRVRSLPMLARVAAASTLRRMIARAVRRRTLAEWLNVLDRRTIPVAPVLTVPEALADPHLAGRQHHVASSNGAPEALLVCAPPALVARPLASAPDLGADTDEVLASLQERPSRRNS
jgi:crotonobetainyl-CoA:carnitine CoA-transferase CaiB-like acyl-CoA transferase